MRVLFITGGRFTGRWLAETLAADNAVAVSLDVAHGMSAGISRLRQELFDAVLISHEPPSLDALDALDAIHAATGDDVPTIVLGEPSEQELSALCYEARGDHYLCVNTATTRGLLWSISRAIERHRLLDENRRLRQTQQHRLRQEHDEAERLLRQQRQMISDLESLAEASSDDSQHVDEEPAEVCLPPRLLDHYRELLRAYVIMGAGNLSEEMTELAALLAAAGVTARQTMSLHLQALEELVHGLGSRSARHVLNRADMLILEVMIQLADRYRQLGPLPKRDIAWPS